MRFEDRSEEKKVNSKNSLFDRERGKEIISGEKSKTRERIGEIVGKSEEVIPFSSFLYLQHNM